MNDAFTAILVVTGVSVLVLVYADDIKHAIRNLVDFVTGKN